MAQEGFVLLVTDAPDRTRLLSRGVDRVAPCRYAEPRGALPDERPLLLVTDIHPEADAGAAAEMRRRPRAAGIPLLHLTRDGDAPRADEVSPFLRVMPADASRASVFTAMLEMIDLGSRARERRARALQARAGAAMTVVSNLFGRAATGDPVTAEESARGTQAVMEAVSEVGIRDWLEIVWRHDIGLYQHTLSVAGFAAAFGGEIGLSGPDLRRLTQAALLHDIGKSRIPVEILNKPAALDAAETAQMRTHAAIGADILAAQGGFEPAILDVVRHHHEKLDGSGYPDGLRGGAIADLVRMVTICDIYSALTERRAYRAPMTHAEAVATMTGMRGQLDRTLLLAFAPVIASSVRAWG